MMRYSLCGILALHYHMRYATLVTESCANYTLTRGLEALTRMLFSGHRLVCVRRVRPGNEINENGEWFFCKGKRKP